MKLNKLSQTAQNLANLIPVFHRKVLRPFDKIAMSCLSTLQLFALIVLNESGKITMTELSTKMVTSKQQMTPIIDKLLSLGYVQRLFDASDRRNIYIEITPSGVNLLAKNQEYVAKELEKKISSLSEEDMNKLNNSLTDLYEIFHKLY